MMSSDSQKYHGPFFWLTLAAFVAPIVVAFGAFHNVSRPYTKPNPSPDASGVDHGLWDYLLKSYVENGLVDYDGIERDYLFLVYLRQLGSAEPERLASESDRLALLCNAYNAFVMSGVIIHDVTDSVMNFHDGEWGFFDVKQHILAGETLSLNELEYERIRAHFGEPRIHTALVCAAKSCPPIRPEAYTGKNLERQLADQARLFANDPKYVRFDGATHTLHLSPILKWYGEDFDAGGGYLAFLEERVTDIETKGALSKAKTGEVEVVFNDYDWSLNSQGPPGRENLAGAKRAEFGSGTIPNE